MVHLRTVPTAFHARVVAARLGAEGFVTELRGNVGGPYPFGAVSVWVAEADAAGAAELLLADEVESAFEADDEPAARVGLAWPWRALAVGGLAAMLGAALIAHIGL